MRRNPIYWLLLALAGLFLVRLSLMNDYLGFSADIGSYLMTRNWILGNDLPMPTLHIRPPLIAVYLLPFTETLGDLEGSKVAALFSSVLLGAMFYPFGRLWLSPRLAALGAVLLVLHPLVADGTAGGFVRNLSIGFTLLAWTAQLGLQRGEGHWLGLTIPAVLLVGLNQTIVLHYALGAGLLLLFAEPSEQRRVVIPLLVAFIATLVWLPFYEGENLLSLQFAVVGAPLVAFTPSFYPFTGVYLWSGNLGETFHLALIAGALAFSRRAAQLLPIAVALALLGTLSSGEIHLNNLFHRAPILLPPIAIVCVLDALASTLAKAGDWAMRPTTSFAPLFAGPVIAASLLLLSTLYWEGNFHRTARANDTLDHRTEELFAYIRETTDLDDSFYVHPNGLAWWLGGLSGRHNWSGAWSGPLRFFEREHEAAVCALGWGGWCDPQEFRREYGVDYFLIDTVTWRPIGGMTADPWSTIPPWLEVVKDVDGLRLYRYQDPGLATLELVQETSANYLVDLEPVPGGYLVASLGGLVWDQDGQVVLDLRGVVDAYCCELGATGLLDTLMLQDGTLAYSYYDGKQVRVIAGRQLTRWEPGGIWHLGGALAQHPDGTLYVSKGEGVNRIDPQDERGIRGFRPLVEAPPGEVLRLPTGQAVATGLRHPWRMAFSPQGDLYIADSGEGRWEEVNRVENPASSAQKLYDFGWPYREGGECLDKVFYQLEVDLPCPEAEEPLYAYGHRPGSNHCSIVGGPFWRGYYTFADYCAGKVWRLKDGLVDLLYEEPGLLITGLGTDGEDLYVMADAKVWRLESSEDVQP